MQAALYAGVHDIQLVERVRPVPQAGELLVQVHACGICGTDRHIYHGEAPACPPVILGHEFAGEVVAVGPGVSPNWIGRRVAVDPNIYCGRCEYCRDGRIQLCTGLRAIGVTQDGGFAQFCAVPEAQALPVPEGLSLEEAAMTEPVACCLHGIDLAEVRAGQRVAVLGGGAIGLILAQLARARGAIDVVVSEPAAPRRQLAVELGIDSVAPTELGERLPDGADVVIEAAGTRTTAAQALEIARRGATVLLFGVTPMGQKIEMEPFQVFRKELTIKGSHINPFTMRRALALLESGQVQVAPLITHRIGLADLASTLATPAPPEMMKAMVVIDVPSSP
ncbi:MAG: zinc-dependent alcohol dehydrogenase family protein [Anaerolineae bacterium]|nr:zinc-dependent alcohol dehydrogenase family protein [Anaerolineae bacterium]MDW8099130.1 zinc-dependent alcohol dehydrogenase family protein [Anaerolineae bacterium]